MALGLSSTQANAVLDAYFNQTNLTAPTAIWMKLHVGAPGAAGTSNAATETTRKDVTAVFPAASSGTVTSNVAVTWTSVAVSGSTETYTHFSIWTLVTAGTFLWSGTVSANPVAAGDTFTLASGAATASLSTAS